MKTKRCYIAILFCIALTVVGCAKIDNYKEPDGTLSGKIVDAETNEPIFTEQPDGTRIRLLQKDWNDNPIPQYFWVKPDGTFRNTKIFKGTYEITPVDGPFIPINEVQTVNIGAAADLTFRVTPFLRVKLLSVTVDGTTAQVSYKIERPAGSFKITDAKVFVSTTSQATNASFDNKLSISVDLQSTADDVILATTYTTSVALTSKRSFYLRVGARSEDNVSRRYNYSVAQLVDIP